MQKRRKKRKKRHSRLSQNVTATLAIAGFAAIILTVLGFLSWNLRQEIAEGEQLNRSLSTAIEAEKDRTKSIESVRDSVSTEEFIKEAAKERFGLVESDEILFRADN